jgi:hypothetical protein
VPPPQPPPLQQQQQAPKRPCVSNAAAPPAAFQEDYARWLQSLAQQGVALLEAVGRAPRLAGAGAAAAPAAGPPPLQLQTQSQSQSAGGGGALVPAATEVDDGNGVEEAAAAAAMAVRRAAAAVAEASASAAAAAAAAAAAVAAAPEHEGEEEVGTAAVVAQVYHDEDELEDHDDEQPAAREDTVPESPPRQEQGEEEAVGGGDGEQQQQQQQQQQPRRHTHDDGDWQQPPSFDTAELLSQAQANRAAAAATAAAAAPPSQPQPPADDCGSRALVVVLPSSQQRRLLYLPPEARSLAFWEPPPAAMLPPQHGPPGSSSTQHPRAATTMMVPELFEPFRLQAHACAFADWVNAAGPRALAHYRERQQQVRWQLAGGSGGGGAGGGNAHHNQQQQPPTYVSYEARWQSNCALMYEVDADAAFLAQVPLPPPSAIPSAAAAAAVAAARDAAAASAPPEDPPPGTVLDTWARVFAEEVPRNNPYQQQQQQQQQQLNYAGGGGGGGGAGAAAAAAGAPLVEYSRRFLVASYRALFDRHLWRRDARARHAYEIIRERRPCHLYFDVEFCRRANPRLDGERSVAALLRCVSDAFSRCFDLEVEPEWVVELDSSTDRKFSRHLVVRVPGKCFANAHEDVRWFVREAVLAPRREDGEHERLWARRPLAGEGAAIAAGDEDDDLDAPRACVVDTTVYSRNRHFRLPYCCKAGKDATLLPTPRYALAADGVAPGCEPVALAGSPLYSQQQPLPAAAGDGAIATAQQHGSFYPRQQLCERLLPPHAFLLALVANVDPGCEPLDVCEARRRLEEAEGGGGGFGVGGGGRTAAEAAAAAGGGAYAALAEARRRGGGGGGGGGGAHAAGPYAGEEVWQVPLPSAAGGSAGAGGVFGGGGHDNHNHSLALVPTTATDGPVRGSIPPAGPVQYRSVVTKWLFQASVPQVVAAEAPPPMLLLAPPGAAAPTTNDLALLPRSSPSSSPAQPRAARVLAAFDACRPALLDAALRAVPLVEAEAARRAGGGRRAAVRSVAVCGREGSVTYALTGSAAHWCGNVGRDHRSNFVYFTADLPAGSLVQRCWDPECWAYRSEAVVLLPAAAVLLGGGGGGGGGGAGTTLSLAGGGATATPPSQFAAAAAGGAGADFAAAHRALAPLAEARFGWAPPMDEEEGAGAAVVAARRARRAARSGGQ